MNPLSFTIPIKTVSEANRSRHQHWGTTARRVKAQRKATADCLIANLLCNKEGWSLKNKPRSITLTRYGPRRLDIDNLVRSMKAVRDEIAAQFKFDDGDESVAWTYYQVSGLAELTGKTGLHVTINWDEPPPADFDDKRLLERYGRWHNAIHNFVLWYRCTQGPQPMFKAAFQKWCEEVLA